MTQDWAAVARVVSRRTDELGLDQRELAARAQISPATVREIARHTVERQRSEHTLAALSAALNLHPQHLESVLHKQKPPAPDPLMIRVEALESQLAEVTERIEELKAGLATVIHHFRTRSDGAAGPGQASGSAPAARKS